MCSRVTCTLYTIRVGLRGARHAAGAAGRREARLAPRASLNAFSSEMAARTWFECIRSASRFSTMVYACCLASYRPIDLNLHGALATHQTIQHPTVHNKQVRRPAPGPNRSTYAPRKVQLSSDVSLCLNTAQRCVRGARIRVAMCHAHYGAPACTRCTSPLRSSACGCPPLTSSRLLPSEPS